MEAVTTLLGRAVRVRQYVLHIQSQKRIFDWDENNLRKIRAHRIGRDEAEQAPLNDPIAVYEQRLEEEPRVLYYGESNAGRMLAIVVTERDDDIRVVTAYDLDAGQKQDYLQRRREGE